MKKKNKKMIVRHFLLMELVMAFAIFVFIAGSFYTLNSSLAKYRGQLESQTEALSVVDNFLERLSAVKSPTAGAAEKIFRIEFDRSQLKDKEGISTVFQGKGGLFIVEIKNAKGKVLAKAQLKQKKTAEGPEKN